MRDRPTAPTVAGEGEAEMDHQLPDEVTAIQASLPLDLDAPIPFELTARARRVVAPGSLPPLEVLAGSEAELDGLDAMEDPADTRPARARALRRAGMSLGGIAAELELDPFVISTWIGDVAPVASARRRLRSVDGGRLARPEELRVAARSERLRQRFSAARAQAREEGLRSDPGPSGYLSGLGLVVGTAQIDPHAVLVTVRDREVAAAIAVWLRRHLLTDTSRLRVILRVAPQVPGDVERHGWAESLGVPVERITTTRWRAAPDAGSVEATIRIADAEAAGRLAGWRDALLGALVAGTTVDGTQ